jgi:hypothetical protein
MVDCSISYFLKFLLISLFNLFIYLCCSLKLLEAAENHRNNATHKSKDAYDNNSGDRLLGNGASIDWFLIIAIFWEIKVISIAIIVDSVIYRWVIANGCVKASWLVVNQQRLVCLSNGPILIIACVFYLILGGVCSFVSFLSLVYCTIRCSSFAGILSRTCAIVVRWFGTWLWTTSTPLQFAVERRVFEFL